MVIEATFMVDAHVLVADQPLSQPEYDTPAMYSDDAPMYGDGDDSSRAFCPFCFEYVIFCHLQLHGLLFYKDKAGMICIYGTVFILLNFIHTTSAS